MNEISESNSPKSEMVIRLVASLLLIAGAIALASAVLQLVGAFFLPVGALAAIAFATLWAIRKIRGTNAQPLPDEIKAAAGKVFREAVRLTGKAFRATAVAVKTLREESKR